MSSVNSRNPASHVIPFTEQTPRNTGNENKDEKVNPPGKVRSNVLNAMPGKTGEKTAARFEMVANARGVPNNQKIDKPQQKEMAAAEKKFNKIFDESLFFDKFRENPVSPDAFDVLNRFSQDQGYPNLKVALQTPAFVDTFLATKVSDMDDEQPTPRPLSDIATPASLDKLRRANE